MNPMMLGTASPEEMAQQQQQQALVDALRQQSTFNPAQAQQLAPQQAPAGDASGGLAGGLGNMVGQGANWLGNNMSTANKYGTNVGSQQTNMLQAQDAAFL